VSLIDAFRTGGLTTTAKASRTVCQLAVINAGFHRQIDPCLGIELQYDCVRWDEFQTLEAAFLLRDSWKI
jgi:hypothetical protein